MKVVLKDVRLSFPDIWKAVPYQPGSTPTFGASFLFAKDSPNVKLVTDTIKAVAAEKWNDKADGIVKGLKGNTNKYCFLDGDTKEYQGYAVNLYVRSRSKQRPDVRDRNKNPLVEADGKPYGGCYVNAILDIWAQDNDYGKGIQCTLLGMQFVKDGEAFSGGGSASDDDFDDLGDGADAPDLGGTSDDEDSYV